ncbi:MAG: polyketide synthase dehydratase domain-containing protein, partial [Acidimicrobiales bacterium]
MKLAGSEEHLFTSRLSLVAQPWLGDHVVGGRVLVPGTALLDLVVRAGDEAGCGCVEELTLTAPLVLPGQGAIQLQVRLGEVDDRGCRPVTVYARPDGLDLPWTEHAVAMVSEMDRSVPFGTDAWPPAGAVAVDLAGCYDVFADAGFEYGPVFQGLRAVWRRGEEVFAEVELPDSADAAG